MLESGSIPHSLSPCPAPRTPLSKCWPLSLAPHPNNRPVLGLDPTYDPKAPACIPPPPQHQQCQCRSKQRWQNRVPWVFALVTGLSPGASQLFTSSPAPGDGAEHHQHPGGVRVPPRRGGLGEGSLGLECLVP